MAKFCLVFLALFSCLRASPCALCQEDVIERQQIFEGRHLRILLDYAPRVKGHLLVITKKHREKAHEMNRQEWEELGKLTPMIVQFFSDYLGTDQYILLEKNGPNAYQDIPHVHFHYLPIHTQHWMEVFGKVPEEIEVEKQIQDFLPYFQRGTFRD